MRGGDARWTSAAARKDGDAQRDGRGDGCARPVSDQYTPLRIRAYLQTGVISDGFLPLDAAIYYVVHREQLGAQAVSLPGESTTPGDSEARMPFARCRARRRHWFYACSFAQWGPHTDGVQYWNKRLDLVQAMDLVDFGERRGTVAIGSGRWKAYHMPVFYRHALYVDWYVRADRTELERLLPFVTHLGKKPAQGWGAVLRWEVEAWPEDWSVTGPAGRLMRAVYDPGSPAIYGLRPSYWLPQNQFPARLPELAP